MIAPLRPSDPETFERRRRLSRAHHLVATALLPASSSAPAAPRIAAWKGWVFAAWVIVVTAAYAASMAGIW